MNDLTVRRLEMTIRVAEYLASTRLSFRKGSRGPEKVSEFLKSVAETRALTGKQMSDVAQAHANSAARTASRQALIDAMVRINQCAHGMSVADSGLGEKFRMKWNVGDSKLVATAHAFAEDAEPHAKEFIAFEMPTDFLIDLNAKIADLEKTVDDHNASKTGHVVTRQEIAAAIKKTLLTLAQLDPIIRNKLSDDPTELRKWKNVRHVEHAWVYKKKKEAKAENNPPASPPPVVNAAPAPSQPSVAA